MIQDTSQLAYRNDVLPTLSERLAQTMEALSKLGEATNLELSRYLNWPINSMTPRIYELRKRGLVTEHGKRSCKISGRTAYAWTIKPEQPTLL